MVAANVVVVAVAAVVDRLHRIAVGIGVRLRMIVDFVMNLKWFEHLKQRNQQYHMLVFKYEVYEILF